MRAIEHGDLGQAVTLSGELAHAAQNQTGFVSLVGRANDEDRLTFVVVGPELFGLSIEIAGDDRVGCSENALGGTVVLLELDERCIGKRRTEIENVSSIGATPSVDALVVVADHA